MGILYDKGQRYDKSKHAESGDGSLHVSWSRGESYAACRASLGQLRFQMLRTRPFFALH